MVSINIGFKCSPHSPTSSLTMKICHVQCPTIKSVNMFCIICIIVMFKLNYFTYGTSLKYKDQFSLQISNKLPVNSVYYDIMLGFKTNKNALNTEKNECWKGEIYILQCITLVNSFGKTVIICLMSQLWRGTTGKYITCVND